MSINPDDPDAPYIPERYRQQIEERGRKRLLRKMGIVIFAIFVIAIALVIFISSFPGVPEKSVPISPTTSPVPVITAASGPVETHSQTSTVAPTLSPEQEAVLPTGSPLPETTTESPIAISSQAMALQQVTGVLSVDAATAYLRDEYPASAYRLFSVNATDTPSGRKLYLFGIKPVRSVSADPITPIYTDAFTGNLYVPAEEVARISSRQATAIASGAFPEVHPDRISVRYVTGTGISPAWNFTLFANGAPVLSGSIDPDASRVSAFTRNLSGQERPSAPLLDIADAKQVAERYIADKNGPVSANLSMARYDSLGTTGSPRAGQYVFHYNRLVQGYPCDEDGFTLAVDSVSAAINEYTRTWNSPEFAFAASPQPVVPKSDATYAVLKKAQDTYPGLSSGVQIISADIRWKDSTPATMIQHPASIPLAWKIVFNDELMRKQPDTVPGVAWIDVETGKMLEFDYRD